MAKIQFARGIRQKDLLRANTLPSITRAKVKFKKKLKHFYFPKTSYIMNLKK